MTESGGVRGGARRTLLLALAAVVAVGLVARLGYEIHRLLFDPGGPIDLLIYHGLTQEWFAGVAVYEDHSTAVQPPALFLLLWPIYGWLPEVPTRWLYAATTFPALAALVAILLREARPANDTDRVQVALLAVACYPAAITIGNGQITFYVLLAAVAGMLLVLREPPGACRDMLASVLFLFALVKPNLTLPFFWVIAFRRGWVRPAVAAVVAYLAATGVSIALHGSGLDSLLELWKGWSHRGGKSSAFTGYGNIHVWLGDLGLRAWIFPASGLVFALHGVWSWRHRRADTWVLIGVAAIVARLWAYHRIYDDLLLIFPLIALYRLTRSDDSVPGAGPLLVLAATALATPVTALVERASWILVAVWLAQLVFLMRCARRSTRTRAISAA